MKFIGTVLSVSDVKASRKFYEDLFGLEIYQDYGKNISFSCGLSLQQDFNGFLKKLKGCYKIKYVHDVKEHTWGQRVIRFYDLDGHIIEVGESMKMVIKRFLDSGLSMEETSKRMDVSVGDLQTLLNG